MCTRCKQAHIPISISVNVEHWPHNIMLKSHIHYFRPYGTLIHLNSVHIRIKSSVCVIVLTESIATYGCPSFEWFWQSVDSSNVCSTHPYTQTGFCIVWKFCVSTLYKPHIILSLLCECPSFECIVLPISWHL